MVTVKDVVAPAVSVTVSCVDDAPTAVDDATTVGQDSGTGPIDVLGNDTDVDGGPKQVASVTQPDHGTAAVAAGGERITYAPVGGYCNTQPGGVPDRFTYQLDGGSRATVAWSRASSALERPGPSGSTRRCCDACDPVRSRRSGPRWNRLPNSPSAASSPTGSTSPSLCAVSTAW